MLNNAKDDDRKVEKIIGISLGLDKTKRVFGLPFPAFLQLMCRLQRRNGYRIPKEPTHEATKHEPWTCPTCGNVVREKNDPMTRYCVFCGQALDWGDNDHGPHD